MEINALGTRMTRMIIAFVDVQTMFGTGNKSVATSALAVNAHFVAFATDIRGTARLARAVDTQFAGQTITIAVTYLHANAILTALALRAIVLFRTLALTQSRDAYVLAGTILRSVARIWHSNATLLWGRITVEAERTRARDRVIRATANRIWSTRVFPTARILTLVVNTRFRRRAIFITAAAKDAPSTNACLIH